MPFYRILEISFYALVNLMPYLILSVYAFSKRFRFSPKVVAFLCGLAAVIQILTRFYSVHSGTGSTSYIAIIRFVTYSCLFLLAIKAHWGKVLFVLIIFSNFMNLISLTAFCIEGQFLSHDQHRLYCWHAAIIILGLHLIITLPYSIVVKYYLKPMIEDTPLGREWNYCWIIPATFYLIWQYHVYGHTRDAMDVITRPQNVIYLYIVNMGALFTYYIVFRLNKQMRENWELERQKHYSDIEKIEYQILHDRMEETRQARHDIRHHITTLSDYVENKEYDKLKTYLDSYKKSIPDYQSYLFCQNRSINRILLFFATQAREYDIDFQVSLAIPAELPIPENDLSVLLGNLLENALEACMEQQHGERKIMISGQGDQHSLAFTIDNTCENDIKTSSTGEFLTTKPYGSGLGIASAKHIVSRYNGVFQLEKRNNIFYASFMLYF